ncbi:hypothetical protein M409DRAFT_51449 [Zasmidium cellare ATCC 36951]|uniref:DUF6924 domain-containing protein n=1 Tax=Zasmidium cellare ATCC 36951 TaxID=1080233 RepID=A0A6A6CTD0_ZASCE|nr:uncharacterized protein M409DRAFT_51449 [Zasmidium cellare ATCC 36951]KAF2170404.1 hypothetical protein M409DRAFT_51449 [Zasmidium cellare ATCC 36951]
MSTGLLFVTAPEADFKAINHFLIYARDWEFGDEDTWDNFHLVTSRKDPDLSKFSDSRRNELPATKPGDVTAETSNEWSGASIQDIERYVLDHEPTGIDGNEISLFLILDCQSLRDRTCIIAERYTEWNDDADPPEKFPKEDREKQYEFNKYRAPWDETYICFANLNIGNMDFEDFADDDEGEEDVGADGEGWWTFRGMGSDLTEEQVGRREGVVRRFEGEGKI